jgi:tRNA threonylcarbamoyl adenosine modification protein YeaZ
MLGEAVMSHERWVAIETSATRASVALFEAGVCIASREGGASNALGESLVALLDALLEGRCSPLDVHLWVAGRGPGSFTGIRVGLATAQGIALGTGARVVGVSAFDAIRAACNDLAAAVALPGLPGEHFVAAPGEAPHVATDAELRARVDEGTLRWIGPSLAAGGPSHAIHLGEAVLRGLAADATPLYVGPVRITVPKRPG